MKIFFHSLYMLSIVLGGIWGTMVLLPSVFGPLFLSPIDHWIADKEFILIVEYLIIIAIAIVVCIPIAMGMICSMFIFPIFIRLFLSSQTFWNIRGHTDKKGIYEKYLRIIFPIANR